MQIGQNQVWNHKKGIFIAIEGIDGSGKSFVSDLFCRHLTEQKFSVVQVTMPSPWYRNHELIINANQRNRGPIMSENGIALFLAADKIEFLYSKIIPDLNDGNVVICDRYIYSSFAHWLVRDTICNEWHKQLYTPAVKPDLCWLIDADPQIANERVLNRKKNRPRHYEENFEYMQKVRESYLTVCKGTGIEIIDNTTITQEELQEIVKERVNQEIKEWKKRKIKYI